MLQYLLHVLQLMGVWCREGGATREMLLLLLLLLLLRLLGVMTERARRRDLGRLFCTE
jgi:hypothetical protein